MMKIIMIVNMNVENIDDDELKLMDSSDKNDDRRTLFMVN